MYCISLHHQCHTTVTDVFFSRHVPKWYVHSDIYNDGRSTWSTNNHWMPQIVAKHPRDLTKHPWDLTRISESATDILLQHHLLQRQNQHNWLENSKWYVLTTSGNNRTEWSDNGAIKKNRVALDWEQQNRTKSSSIRLKQELITTTSRDVTCKLVTRSTVDQRCS